MSAKPHGHVGFVVLAICAVMAAGCGGRGVRFSGFLGDYQTLKGQPEAKDVLVYSHEQARLDDYAGIMVDPVAIYYSAKDSADLDETTIERIKIQFRQAIEKAFWDRYPVVEKKDEDVLRLRAAITNLKVERNSGEQPADNDLGYALNIDDVTLEAEFLDSMTGERIVALVDGKAGTRIGNPRVTQWDQVQSTLNYWVKPLRRMFDRAHDRTNIIGQMLDVFEEQTAPPTSSE